MEEHRDLYDWNYIRRQVEKRDRGVCAACGCDTTRVARLIASARNVAKRLGLYTWAEFNGGLRVELFGTRRGGYDLWEADHIVPREQGGTNAIANLRTLCVGCHHDVTARQARARAAKRWVLDHPAFA